MNADQFDWLLVGVSGVAGLIAVITTALAIVRPVWPGRLWRRMKRDRTFTWTDATGKSYLLHTKACKGELRQALLPRSWHRLWGHDIYDEDDGFGRIDCQCNAFWWNRKY